MPTTVVSRPAHSACRAWRRGISRRQGAHQVAQKLMTRDWPVKELMEVGLPVRSAREKAGSRSGILVRDGWPPASAPSTKSLGLAGLASPADTGTPEWLGAVPRAEETHAPA